MKKLAILFMLSTFATGCYLFYYVFKTVTSYTLLTPFDLSDLLIAKANMSEPLANAIVMFLVAAFILILYLIWTKCVGLRFKVCASLVSGMIFASIIFGLWFALDSDLLPDIAKQKKHASASQAIKASSPTQPTSSVSVTPATMASAAQPAPPKQQQIKKITTVAKQATPTHGQNTDNLLANLEGLIRRACSTTN